MATWAPSTCCWCSHWQRASSLFELFEQFIAKPCALHVGALHDSALYQIKSINNILEKVFISVTKVESHFLFMYLLLWNQTSLVYALVLGYPTVLLQLSVSATLKRALLL